MIEKACRDADDGDRRQQPAEAGGRRIEPIVFLSPGLVLRAFPQREKQTVNVSLHPAAKSVAARRTVESDGSRHFCARFF
ncbi:hypothetical protein [Mesorhizobium sp. M4A.F.Ca.ET.050.02.1.1]|uniref:hypothetical protein n=1 Tax=Mesorhizobium sp. M4A.F.Ca.ET.050.02.1.1 TaxID=2496754 RepID=UPI00167ED794|nr:hypothetical protein [Mesorhizobium sp. M4A.F.Ca.ET.050.02.1.1]